MAWRSPRTWATGDGVWVYTLNTEIRDRMMTLRHLNDAAVHVSLTTAQTIPDSETVNVHWDTQDWGASGETLWSRGDSEKFLAPIAGWYELQAVLVWAISPGSGLGGRFLRYGFVEQENLNYDMDYRQDPGGGPSSIVLTGSDWVQMTTADILEVRAYQDTGDDLPLIGSTGTRCRASWRLLGGAT